MPTDSTTYPKFDHNSYAKTRAPDDFWGQVRRTVNGVSVSDDQINLIRDTITLALNLKSDDILLDIACGNGALSHLFFESCSGYLGVDLSEHLISVAKTNFETLPGYQFTQKEAAKYVRSESRSERFSKVLCYGSFSYFSTDDAAEVLKTLYDKFCNVQKFFIGNLPDRDMANVFYKKQLNTKELSDCFSQIGIWRTRDEFKQLANNAGWQVNISSMPDEFYSSYYRYDVLLSR